MAKQTRDNVGVLLDKRRRRWANITPTLVQRLVFAGTFYATTCYERPPAKRARNSCATTCVIAYLYGRKTNAQCVVVLDRLCTLCNHHSTDNLLWTTTCQERPSRHLEFPANTTHRTNVGLMLAHRLRRRPNINSTLVQCLVFAELPIMV